MNIFRPVRFLAPLLATAFGVMALAQTADDSTLALPRPDDVTIVLPEGTMLLPPTINDDGSLTLSDGTTILPSVPPLRHNDGSITLPDGTKIEADGTITLSDGAVVDPSRRRDLGARRDRAPDQRPPAAK